MTGQRRGRGVVLTNEGWKKLEIALHEWESNNNFDKPYTIEALIEVTQLDPATISKVLHREVGVDKRTLERFFRGFNLDLNKHDYTKLNLINNYKQHKHFCSVRCFLLVLVRMEIQLLVVVVIRLLNFGMLELESVCKQFEKKLLT